MCVCVCVCVYFYNNNNNNNNNNKICINISGINCLSPAPGGGGEEGCLNYLSLFHFKI